MVPKSSIGCINLLVDVRPAILVPHNSYELATGKGFAFHAGSNVTLI